MDSFEGKTVLITGASGGIGASFARQLAAQKANLVLVARSRNKLEDLAKTLSAEYGTQNHVFQCDLSVLGEAEKLFQKTQQHQLQIDVLINNAGFGQRGFFAEEDLTRHSEMINLNVHALVILSHLYLREMVARKNGGIINIASTASFQPIPYLSLYAATKSFVLSFTEGLWGEYQKEGVRVLCLCPGNTRTKFHHNAEIGKDKVFFAASADAVARHGLFVFLKGRRASTIYGWMNRLLAQSTRFSPRALVLLIARMIYR